MQKVIHVKAHFENRFKNTPNAWAPKQKSSSSIVHGQVDGVRLERDLNQTLETLNSEGYAIVSVSPVTSGYSNVEASIFDTASSPAVAYGYSFTSGFIVIANKL